MLGPLSGGSPQNTDFKDQNAWKFQKHYVCFSCSKSLKNISVNTKIVVGV